MSFVSSLLRPPAIDGGPIEQQKANILYAVTVCTSITALFALVTFGFILQGQTDTSTVLLTTGSALIVACVCNILLRKQQTKLTGQFISLALIGVIGMAAVMTRGSNSFATEYLVAPIAIAFLTVNIRWGISIALLCLSLLVASDLMNQSGVDIGILAEQSQAIQREAVMHRALITSGITFYFLTSKYAMDRANRQMRNGEQRIHQMLDLMADAAFQITLDGTIAAMNHRASLILGYDSADLVGRKAAILAKNYTSEDLLKFIQSMELNVPYTRTLTLVTKDGNELIGEQRSVRMGLENETLIFTIVRDVTEEITTRKQLADSQAELANVTERLMLIANNLPAMISFVSKSEDILFLNHAFRRLGVNPERVSGKKIADIMPPQSYQYVKPFILESFSSTEPVRFDFPTTTSEGVPIIVDTIHIPHVANGEVVGYFGLGSDVTEERQLMRDLQESKQAQQELAERLQLIADHLPVRIAYMDHTNRILFANKRYDGLDDLSAQARVGKHVADVVPPETYRQIEPNLAKAQSGTEINFLIEHTDADGRALQSEISYVPHVHRGKIVGIVALSRDVTEERQQQMALHESQRLESLGLMAGGIAHDFNNLLVAILGQASIAKMKLGEAHPAFRHIEKSVQAAERARGLTNQMLAYSGHGQFEIRPVDFNTLIQQNMHLIESAAGTDIRLVTSFKSDLPLIEADASQMQQVVMNLMINATQAIGEKRGMIELRTDTYCVCDGDAGDWHFTGDVLEQGHYISFTISDTGSGIPPSDVQKIFEPFYSTKETGSGLGLSAVLGIIRGHNGAIRVVSHVDEGTAFQLILPAKPTWQPLLTDDNSAEPPPHTAHGPVETVLIIDDEVEVAETVADMLELAELPSLVANSGQEGLALFKAHRANIAIVLLDLMMPDMDGSETFQHLTKIDPDVRVIITSGYSETEASKRFVGLDLAGFIQKPYQPSELFKKVNSIIESGSLVPAD